MEGVTTQQNLDKKLDNLLDQFEREVEPYDRWAGISMFATPVGVVASIFVPLMFHISWPSLEISQSVLYWIVGGILATIGLAKIPLLYVDHKKHEISRVKYRPMAGVCMCDLSNLRSHMRQADKAGSTGDRIRHTKLVNYYRHQIGWE
ncbi:MAG TPA: hypothetical protein VGQ03_02825 [Nitrososphaera sp.]|jgi:hypothetical protein|nr:hypothetical protein [Nitrososphaera sp.]